MLLGPLKVLLVGGMTRMPKVQTIVEDFFGKKPSKGMKPCVASPRFHPRPFGDRVVLLKRR
jgi:hypothetical protein